MKASFLLASSCRQHLGSERQRPLSGLTTFVWRGSHDLQLWKSILAAKPTELEPRAIMENRRRSSFSTWSIQADSRPKCTINSLAQDPFLQRKAFLGLGARSHSFSVSCSLFLCTYVYLPIYLSIHPCNSSTDINISIHVYIYMIYISICFVCISIHICIHMSLSTYTHI